MPLVAALAFAPAVVAGGCTGSDPTDLPDDADGSFEHRDGTGAGEDAGSFDAQRSGDPDVVTDSEALEAASPPCDLGKPFATPTVVTSVNTQSSDFGARLTTDGLTIVFSSDRNSAGYEIYRATRSRIGDPFGTASLMSDVTVGAADDRAAMLSTDGKSVYLRSNRTGTLGFNDIFYAGRASTDAGFAPAVSVGTVNDTSDDVDPYISADGTTLYFSSNRSGDYEIYRATGVGATFGTASPIAEINGSASFESYPVLTTDELTIFFTSDRAGNTDVWTAHRTTKNDGFGTPTRVDELSTGSNDSPTWISPDGCTIYLHSDRTGGAGAFDVWAATRPK